LLNYPGLRFIPTDIEHADVLMQLGCPDGGTVTQLVLSLEEVGNCAMLLLGTG
jgi:hypothetical protein